MKNLKLIIGCIFVLGWVIACGPAPDAATPTPGLTNEGEDVFPRPTITPMPQGDESESVTQPEATAEPDDYPAPPEQATQPEGYPASAEQAVQPESAYPGEDETTWVVFPVGIQCEEGSEYADLDEAIAALDVAGVTIVDQGTSELIVAAACGQPTSEHYGAEILSDGVPQAESLGWKVFNE